MGQKKVLAFAGSTRTDSVNKKLVANAARLAKEMGADVTLIDLRDLPLPFYDGDLELKEGLPKNAKYIQQLMLDSSVILIASPEYNSSLSGVLKNTIDWVSRNEKAEGFLGAFKDKIFGIMGASPGSRGAARGLVHLRSILQNVGGIVVEEQIAISNAYEAFDEKSHFNLETAVFRLKDPGLELQLKIVVQAALNA